MTFDDRAITALMQAEHGDPFAVLGIHAEAGATVVRALLPGATAVTVIDGATVLANLARQGGSDVFAAAVPGLAAGAPYRLRVDWGSHQQDIDDPYRFGPLLGDTDLWLLAEGTHYRPFEKLGAHLLEHEGVAGVNFAVWAPNARRVSVAGSFNGWDGRRHPMRKRGGSGIWELFLPGVVAGDLYKFELGTRDGAVVLKADPYAFQAELRPATASVVAPLPPIVPTSTARRDANALGAPISIYEVHLGSWRRVPEQHDRWLTYRELAAQLIPYVKELGFTHIELLPVSEHPFDGTHLYEHADPREGFHQDWNTLIFNYGRREVRNYLVGNALYWIERFGIDGLRVDAVASMLYRDYSRKEGEWVPNVHGGRENLEAIAFLKTLNQVICAERPEAIMIAEESTSFPQVSRPLDMGGLGFHYKWNLGWMNDTLRYMHEDPVHRTHHHDKLTFGLAYAFSENFILPLSHDEVVHGKGSILARMPGDAWQRFANLRAYYGFMWGHPGKKLLFMGCEFGQEQEWNVERSLDWHLLDAPPHAGVQRLVHDLNAVQRHYPALHQFDFDDRGFAWIARDDRNNAVFSFVRKADDGATVVVLCNFTPVPRHGYRIGAAPGSYRELINTDALAYGGSGLHNGLLQSEPVGAHGYADSLVVTVPPLATLMLLRDAP